MINKNSLYGEGQGPKSERERERDMKRKSIVLLQTIER